MRRVAILIVVLAAMQVSTSAASAATPKWSWTPAQVPRHGPSRPRRPSRVDHQPARSPRQPGQHEHLQARLPRRRQAFHGALAHDEIASGGTTRAEAERAADAPVTAALRFSVEEAMRPASDKRCTGSSFSGVTVLSSLGLGRSAVALASELSQLPGRALTEAGQRRSRRRFSPRTRRVRLARGK